MQKKIKEILIIDDDPITRKLVSKFLPATEFKVVEADSIGQAVEYLLENTPHLILLDMMLPDMSGLEFQKECANLIPQGVIVIALSSRSEKKVINKAIEQGAKDYIIKPPKRNELLITVKKYLKEQPEFSKTLSGIEEVETTAIIEGELIAIGETNIIIKSPIKIRNDEEILISSETLENIGLNENQYITIKRYDHKFSSSKYTGLTFRGAKNNTIKEIRSMVIRWNKLFE